MPGLPAYLQRQTLYPPLVQAPVSENLGVTVVIPCHDEPDLITTLESLWANEHPGCSVEVIIVINASEKAEPAVKARNQSTFDQAQQWADNQQQEWIHLHCLLFDDWPHKHAGVGMARKVGMDEAARRFDCVGRPDGVILCFDADSQCDSNYLKAVHQWFKQHPRMQAAGIHFEHPLAGEDFDPEVYAGIVRYELFLRYYKNGLAYAQHPYAYHTIGSSMAVRADAYMRQGGMNKRKAGEDFYFLQKFIELDTVGEITNTRVIPSPRPSHRVPFGTGRAIGQWLETSDDWPVYPVHTFDDLRTFCMDVVPQLYNADFQWQEGTPAFIRDFLLDQGMDEALTEIRANCRTKEQFDKRFYRWFNAFRVLKLVHAMRDGEYGTQPVEVAAAQLLERIGKGQVSDDPIALLEMYRQLDLG